MTYATSCDSKTILSRQSALVYSPFVIFACICASTNGTNAMSEPNANRDKLDQRVTNLESLFTHLEKTVSDLDGVVVDGHKKIEELSNKVDNLEKKIESEKHDFPDEIRDLL